VVLAAAAGMNGTKHARGDIHTKGTKGWKEHKTQITQMDRSKRAWREGGRRRRGGKRQYTWSILGHTRGGGRGGKVMRSLCLVSNRGVGREEERRRR
jgi:hypothetical protein